MSAVVIKRGRTVSPRESQVLDALLEYGNNKDIGRSLGITEKTVEHHMRTALAPSGCRDRVLLALWWDRKKRVAA